MFLILSAMTALLECGPLFLGIGLGYGPGRTLSFCLAYQAGNLFPIPFSLRPGTLRKVTLLSLPLLCLAPFMKALPLLQWGLYFTGILLLSCAVQSIRAKMKTHSGTIRKRLARVAGFLLAPLAAFAAFPLLPLCCLLVWFSLGRLSHDDDADLSPLPKGIGTAPKLYPLCAVMFWHQLHYFIYAYGMLLHAYQITGSAFLTMLFFACTWLTYLSAEPIVKWLRRARSRQFAAKPGPSDYIAAILAGHTFLLLILLWLPQVPDGLFFCLWILTGFGGGTVFAITALCGQSAAYNKEQLVYTENLGHFLGTGFAVLWAFLLPHSLSLLSYPAALCVFLVILLSFLKKRNKIDQKTQRREQSERSDKVYENTDDTGQKYDC